MGRYLKLFKTHENYADFVESGEMLKPNVSHCVQDNEVHYNPHTFSDEYLTFIALENGTLEFGKHIQYSLDNGETWSESVMEGGYTKLTITTGDKIMCKFEVTQEMIEHIDHLTTLFEFRTSGRVNVQGNIMSMLYGDNFVGQTSLIDNIIFMNAFRKCDVVSAEKLVLPATTLTERCYAQMFMDCEYLTTAPELPATTLAQSCYDSMFYGCTSLTTAPELSATTLAESCYSSMFYDCTSLTTAPELPATTLGNSCYYDMFSDCTSLTTAPELPATTLADGCYSGMFYGCTSLTTAPELPATTLTNYCYSGMFNGCTSLTTAPELPATTLTNYCYSDMFNGCTSLTTAPELPATTLAESCYADMFNGCTSLTDVATVPNSVKPVSRTYCDAMYAYTNVPQSSDYDSCAYYTQQEPEID